MLLPPRLVSSFLYASVKTELQTLRLAFDQKMHQAETSIWMAGDRRLPQEGDVERLNE